MSRWFLEARFLVTAKSPLMTLFTKIKQRILESNNQPLIVTGGLFAFTALYYTRNLVLQLISFLLLVLVALLWNQSLKRVGGFSWATFKLVKTKLWRDIIIALALAVFGWFWYGFYIHLTRGHWIPFGFGGSYTAILAIIAVSVAEELFFRGYLQNHLGDQYSRVVRILIAVVALALFKNIVHVWEGLPLSLHLELFFLGVLHNTLASIWLEWSGNLAGPLVLHVVWDLLVYAPMSEIPYWVI
jgi:membrane protease YdiL (CAAX protease family)